MHSKTYILGIDVGSVAVSAALINPQQKLVQSVYRFHKGNITEQLSAILSRLDLGTLGGIATTASTPPIIHQSRQFDNQVCLIEACRRFHGKVGAVLDVGGEKFGLIQFNRRGNYRSYRANTSCAAGTGSFLDQQAGRLNLDSSQELGEIAYNNKGAIPKIASRCAVFAKTDLVHAQQEGYCLAEICDGLCYGLAKNIVDTLFNEPDILDPVVFTGGVSQNPAVKKHIQSLTGKTIIADDQTRVAGATGAALNLLDDLGSLIGTTGRFMSIDDILIQATPKKTYAFPPIELKDSNYPEFGSYEHTLYDGHSRENSNAIEVDIYEPLVPGQSLEAYLGIDIGSTSTKAILMHADKNVIVGFYTRTAGRPIDAVQKILAAVDAMVTPKDIRLRILGAATTGSGRKFIGNIIGVDLIIDEITAHARAAVNLNPAVDTIIEIGGQDSKFTTLQNGRVTFSIMNNVCAAGTGSFLEEQAQRLGCPLSDYAMRAEHRRSPCASDRCTVFMERDINYYLNEGYAVDDVLAAALHSIVENYLTKVAVENSIGDTILFQGATAKNKALVAAFEQRLKKPIQVSKFCHLTGALGTAIALGESPPVRTSFKGIDLHQQQIPIRSEVCQICANHCKISVAAVDGETVAYGFLCGRDYDTQHHVDNNRSGFDLWRARKRALAFKPRPPSPQNPVIGLPATLYMVEDLPFWRKFFDALSIATVTSERYDDALKVGKSIARAEFCAPLTALHGHVHYLQDQMQTGRGPKRPDFIFLPIYLEKKTKVKSGRRQYCYYTQYSSGLATGIPKPDQRDRLLQPLVNYLYNRFHTKAQLYRMLKSISSVPIRFKQVSDAYEQAVKFKQSGLRKLKEIYQEHGRNPKNLHVVLLGRPYTILDKTMNKGIPDIFASLGIKTFYQDMLSYTADDIDAIQPLLEELHWHYAAEILAAAETIGKSAGAYPVLMTAFKCSPDSFVVEYFKKIMESHAKPYLILQLDEHSSSVGYETRIEAALRSFQNHYRAERPIAPAKYAPVLKPKIEKQLLNKTLVFPNWDEMSLRLVVANLRRAGVDARLLNENETSIQKGLRYNTGQCLPLNIIAQGFIDYIENHNLDPEKTVLWLAHSEIACNIRLYPHHIKHILDTYGNGMQKAGVYVGYLSLSDISLKLPINTYFAYMFGGLVRKIGCRLRPYEKEAGTVDQTIAQELIRLEEAFAGKRAKTETLQTLIRNFGNIEIRKKSSSEQRPQVAIFGDLYARDNTVMNQDLIHFIEDHGGEVVTTPYSSYVKMIAKPYLRKWLIEGRYLNVLKTRALLAELNRRDKKYYKIFNRLLQEEDAHYDEKPERILAAYNLRIEHTGESMENILKIFYLKKYHPHIALFVQTSPAFCCPALITEAMTREIEHQTGIPIVSITYDGTGGAKNKIIIPYLKYPLNRTQKTNTRQESETTAPTGHS
jgi:predicted CoA-substrate-specific enzyme activase